MSAFISLIKYAWCRMMAGFWGKVADATNLRKETKKATPEGGGKDEKYE